ncbi:uncharacterized protein PV09_01244 [Verruconis gallopava]|uniref:Translation machinery-associated protein 7 n=1 Tax=Verruconis gallopava TaxID=253628 RepID=A0A0D1Z5T4_9PEZI|nr:uncharacterized protein PV09_01244 [Verruconis gallopava]KIW08327.1 hypothetical protein PV09_01244 [Verruconis gallopava]
MPSGQGVGTNPLHNKKPKKKVTEEDEDDKAYKAKVMAEKKAAAEKAKELKNGGKLGTGLSKSGGKKK